jgi:ubiquinone/menaquinone biosynthesis C-methylase UbiE
MSNAVKDQPIPKSANWYKRLFAYMMAKSSFEHIQMVIDRKRTLLGPLHGKILEIGAGAAPNLAYYAADVQWLGIEPNPAMFQYAQKEAQRLGRTIELRSGEAESLPVPEGSMDAVVSTLVLCSVHDPAKSLQEIQRVLKPGGKFVFIEHVAAPAETGSRRWQSFIRPAWKLGADGCNPDRETWKTIENAGFSQVQIEHFHLDLPIVGPHIAGVAVN